MRSEGTIGRRQLLIGFAAGGVGLCQSHKAWASTVTPVPLNQLVWRSQHIVVGVPEKGESLWETTQAGTRIVTYTPLNVLQSLDGRPPSQASLLVRTLGGRVGDVGQLVDGEAELEADRPSVFFLRQTGDAFFAVSAMAQGHYPLRTDAEQPRLLQSPRLAHGTEGSPTAAFVRLRGTTVPECEQLIWQEMK